MNISWEKWKRNGKECKNSKRNKLSRIEKENKMKYSIQFNTISRKVMQ